MSYVDHSHRPSPASMAAVIGVHAAIGAILVAGLTVTGTVPISSPGSGQPTFRSRRRPRNRPSRPNPGPRSRTIP